MTQTQRDGKVEVMSLGCVKGSWGLNEEEMRESVHQEVLLRRLMDEGEKGSRRYGSWFCFNSGENWTLLLDRGEGSTPRNMTPHASS